MKTKEEIQKLRIFTEYECNSCHHKWYSRLAGLPLCCPKCKSYTWNKKVEKK